MNPSSLKRQSNSVILFFENFFRKRAARKVLENIKKQNEKSPNIVIFEPNPFHGEVIPGFVKYFLEIGCQVHVVIRKEIAREKPFAFLKEKRLFVHELRRSAMYFLYHMLGNETDLVFISTAMDYTTDRLFISQLNHDINYGTASVEHHLNNFEKHYSSPHLNQLKIVTLQKAADFTGAKNIVPLFYREYKRAPKIKETARFIVAGGVLASKRDYSLLLESSASLVSKGLDFEVILVGGHNNFSIPPELRSYIKIMGRVSFPTLYDELEKADFILPLLNEYEPMHETYKKDRVSGARQLMFGFSLPCVINDSFMKSFSIDDNECISYKKNYLAHAMETAIKMDSESYVKITKRLENHAEELFNVSLSNVKQLLK